MVKEKNQKIDVEKNHRRGEKDLSEEVKERKRKVVAAVVAEYEEVDEKAGRVTRIKEQEREVTIA